MSPLTPPPTPHSAMRVALRVALRVASAAALTLTGCQRPTFERSSALDCEGGDAIVVISHALCVFDPAALSARVEALGGAQAGAQAQSALCPAATPYEHSYLNLLMCSSEEELTPELLEAAAAEWALRYGRSTTPSAPSSTDLGAADLGAADLGATDLGGP